MFRILLYKIIFVCTTFILILALRKVNWSLASISLQILGLALVILHYFFAHNDGEKINKIIKGYSPTPVRILKLMKKHNINDKDFTKDLKKVI